MRSCSRIRRKRLRFVRQTGVDALAVSCGTAHGVYMVKHRRSTISACQAIRTLTPVHLVLHGGSGVPAEMMKQAIQLPGGGVSKVNIATDLELAFLAALGREERMTNEACKRLSPTDWRRASGRRGRRGGENDAFPWLRGQSGPIRVYGGIDPH